MRPQSSSDPSPPGGGSRSYDVRAMLRSPKGVVFDLDGVLIDTARLHGRAWKAAFDRLFDELELDDEFDETEDYRRYVDGRPRYEGVASLLRSRRIELPAGEPDDEPGFGTEAAVGNLKNRLFHDLVESEGVDMLAGVEDLVESLSSRGVPMAIVSSSRNATRVLPEDLGRHFEVVLGGMDIAELGIPGKPEPDMFVEGARRLGVSPQQSAVVEDAPAGVLAGRRGGFAVVVGIDPLGSSGLDEAGADYVVGGVGTLPRDIGEWATLIPPPARALDEIPRVVERLDGRPALFFDYDGTLTPIVDDPASATIGDRERALIARLAEVAPVAVVSGRALDDVKSHVAVPGITYSGSHGFEIERADGVRSDQTAAVDSVPQLDEAEVLLAEGSAGLTGVMVERKPYAIAVHTRRAGSEAAREAAAALARDVAGRFDRLVLRGGKEIHELRPAFDWDKGSALLQLLDLMDGDRIPVYIGDDETDEDGFLAVRRRSGVGVRVGGSSGAETWADYTVAGPAETLSFLAALTGSLGQDG